LKIIRFLIDGVGKHYWGVIKSGNTIEILKREPFDKVELSDKRINLSQVKLLAPVIPSKIIAVGLNYKDHAKELKMPLPGEPIIFMKPPTSVIGSMEEIIYPRKVKQLDYEAELAVVISKTAKNINENDAANYIFGYTCANDITARDLQRLDGQWARAKSFDTFCPLGPWIETDFNYDSVPVECLVNGEIKQSGNTKDMIFSIKYIVSFISSIMTLYPQDVILTGTPKGVGSLKENDVVEVSIQGIGRLTNKVVA
jgi:2-keto-4-pentenoate hydratase/2-oxohepta-3-ene-1,7-dioic acid hydratase in catechol pathway